MSNNLLISGTPGSGKTTAVLEFLNEELHRLDLSDISYNLCIISQKIFDFSAYQKYDFCYTIPIDTSDYAMEEAMKCFISLLQKQKNHLNKSTYTILIIDELLLSTKSIDEKLEYLLTNYRSDQLRLIVSCPYPSTKMISSVAKSYFTERACFYVTSRFHSELSLDSPIASSISKPYQYYFKTPFSNLELRTLKNELLPIPVQTKSRDFLSFNEIQELSMDSHTNDPLYIDALAFVTDEQRASTSLLQRKFKIGYNRAANIIDQLEQNGIIGSANGSKPRDVYASHDSTS